MTSAGQCTLSFTGARTMRDQSESVMTQMWSGIWALQCRSNSESAPYHLRKTITLYDNWKSVSPVKCTFERKDHYVKSVREKERA